jgi:DNA-binding CsgD family transcriptional regulator
MSFGGTTIDSSIATRLTLTLVGAAALRSAKRMSGIRVQSEPRRLTKREREVIRWIASGRKQADAAILLGLSERTVENHLRRIRKRLGVANTAQAIQVSMQRGELDG